jgi:hypothetical protein
MKNVNFSMNDVLEMGQPLGARHCRSLNHLDCELREAEVGQGSKVNVRELFASMDAGRPTRRGYRWNREDASLRD